MMLDELLDFDRIAEGLAVAFPDLDPVRPLRLLVAGFRSVAVETAGGVVVRIARNAAAMAGHAKEVQFLPELRGRVPVAVPDPRWQAGPSEHFPFGALGYPKLPGAPLLPEDLAGTNLASVAAGVVAFLLALHQIPREEAVGLPVMGPDAHRRELAALRDEVLPSLRGALTEREYRIVARWWDELLADRAMAHYPPAVCHGDLWYENILVERANGPGADLGVTGVLDWENAVVGDRARDFATQLHLGAPFAERVITAYRAAGGELDVGFERRMWRHWELREFDGIGFAVREADAAEFADGVRKLRQGPILGGSHPGTAR
jgi:aminoglycoside 2''-phosphotransferase